MVSAISSQGHIRFMVYQDTMNQQRLIRFMDRLVRGSKRKVFLILDNLKVHHGKLAAAWLEKHKDKIEVFFLPPYAPEYNPDEYLNHTLKISVHSGLLPYTSHNISHKIRSFMRKLQHHPTSVSNFFLHFFFPIYYRKITVIAVEKRKKWHHQERKSRRQRKQLFFSAKPKVFNRIELRRIGREKN